MSITSTIFVQTGLTGQTSLLQDYINTSGLITSPGESVTSISYTDPNGTINYNAPGITGGEETNILAYIASITFGITFSSFTQAAPVNLSQIETFINTLLAPSSKSVLDIEYADPNGTVNYSVGGISSLQDFYVAQYFSTYTYTDNSIAVFIPDFAQFGNRVTLNINQTANRTLTLPDTTDTVVTLAYAQTLTNKTMTSNTNNVTSTGLFSSSGANTVNVASSTNPTNHQVLTATSGTVATWQDCSAANLLSGGSTNFVNVSAASNPVAGQVLTATSATTAVWQTPTPFGIIKSQVSGQSTTTNTYQLVTGSTLTFSFPASSTYVLFYSWQYTYSRTDRSFSAQVLSNTPTVDTVLIQQQSMQSNNSTSERYSFSGVTTVSSVSAVPSYTFYVKFKAENSGDTASIYNVTLVAYEIV